MKIGIVGLGWLGMPLAKHFLSKGHSVIGTKLNPTGAKTQQEELEIVKLEWSDSEALQILESLVSQVDVVLFNLPPKALGKEDVAIKFEDFAEVVNVSNTKRAILVSSSGVFGNVIGEVDENTPPQPVSSSGVLLTQLEHIWKQCLGKKSIVVRPGGLIGPDRHPVNFLSGRVGVKGPNEPVNLVHLDDLIGLLFQVAIRDNNLPIYHAVASNHPTRKAYYCDMAVKLGLPIPEFNLGDRSLGKVVKSENSSLFLDIKYKYDDPFEML